MTYLYDRRSYREFPLGVFEAPGTWNPGTAVMAVAGIMAGFAGVFGVFVLKP
jgi:hypothetical protein